MKIIIELCEEKNVKNALKIVETLMNPHNWPDSKMVFKSIFVDREINEELSNFRDSDRRHLTVRMPKAGSFVVDDIN